MIKNYFGILSVALLLLTTSCVTETKPDDGKIFSGTASDVTVKAASPEVAAGGGIVVKCRVSYDRDPRKTLLCGPSNVKLTNEFSKDNKDYSFKGDKVTIPVARGVSYSIEIKTAGCPTPRVFQGMTTGMALTAQFENCGGNVK